MKYVVLILMVFYVLDVAGQTKVLHPKPLVIDLSKPRESAPKNLDRKAKKKWKALKKANRLEKKALNKLYAAKLDSIQELTNLQMPDAGILNYFPDSSAYSDYRLGILDSLKLESDVYATSELQKLKRKYNIPDSLIHNDSLHHKLFRPKDAVPGFLAFDSLALDTTVVAVNRDNLMETIDLDSSNVRFYEEWTHINDSLNHIDYTALSEQVAMQNIEKEFSSNLLPEELGAGAMTNEDLLSSYQEAIGAEQYQELMSSMPGKKEELESRIKTQELSIDDIPVKPDFFAGKEKELLKAQEKLVIIKKKRAFKEFLKTLINQDMEGVKQQSFMERLALGGFIQVSGSKPVLVDYSPTVAYKVTSRIALGVGANGRFAIGDEPSDEKDMIGYRGFMEYDIIGRIYLHGEFERTGLQMEIAGTDSSVWDWTQRWLIGLGKDFSFGPKTQGSLLILYNLNNGQPGPHSQNFQVRYGLKF